MMQQFENRKTEQQFIESVELSIGQHYITDQKDEIYFNGVLKDSRCPKGVQCVKAGNGRVNLTLAQSNGTKHDIELNTNRRFPMDTIINGIYILLMELNPYPGEKKIKNKKRTVKLVLANTNNLESNATIIGRSRNKCFDGSSWSITTGGDTIRSNSHMMWKVIGSMKDFPIKVCLKLGGLEKTCKENGGYDHYRVDKVVKLE